MMSMLTPCGSTAKQYDPDRFFLSLFAPPACRPALWAVFAFNYEIAKTREVVTETQLGLIRLQWWRDRIDDIYEGKTATGSDVLDGLEQAIHAYDLPQELFHNLLYAREFDLEDVLPSTLEGTIRYADFTATPLFTLALHITGGDPDLEPVQAIATNYALAGLLRAVPFHAAQRRCYLPDDLLRERDINLNRLYAGQADESLNQVVESVTEEIIGGIQAKDRALKAAQALAMIYKKQIMSRGFDVFHPRLRLDPAFKALRVWLGSYMG